MHGQRDRLLAGAGTEGYPRIEMSWRDGLERAYHLIVEKLTTWLETALRLVPNVFAALVVLVIFALLGRLLRGGVRRALRPTGIPRAIAGLVAQAAYLGMWGMGLFIGLSVLNLDRAVTSLLAGVGIVGLALSFAFQDIAANFISGILVVVQRPLRVGDLVRTNDFLGVVESVGLRSIVLRDLDGQHVVLPSKDVLQTPLVNFSTDSARRVSLDVGISYGEDLSQVEAVTLEAIQSVPGLLGSRPVKVHWKGFGSSSIDFTLRFWIDRSDQMAYHDAVAAAVKALKVAFDEQGIVIPFPIRTLDFGIKGGQTAQEVVAAVDERRHRP